MGDEARHGVEQGGQRRGVAHLAVVVGDHAAVGCRRRVAQHRVGERAQGGRQPEGQELERDGRVQPIDRLVGGHDDDEPVGGRGHDPLAGLRAAPALDQPAERVDLVGPVDGQVEPVDVGEGPDVQPVGDGELLGRRRGRDAGDVQAARPERRDQLGDGRPGSQPDPHAALHQRRRRLRGDALLGLRVRSRHDRCALSCAGRPSRGAPCRCGRRPEGPARVRPGCCA